MPAPTTCSVCEHPDRDRIDAALKGGSSLRGIEKTFGIGRTAVSNHAARHTKSAETRRFRQAARGGKRRGPKIVAPAAESRIESPSDVARELEWQYREAKALVEHGKATSDSRLIDKALSTCGALMDKFAKMLGIYTDGTVVNLDQRSIKVAQFYDSLPTDMLRKLKAGEITIDAVIGNQEALP